MLCKWPLFGTFWGGRGMAHEWWGNENKVLFAWQGQVGRSLLPRVANDSESTSAFGALTISFSVERWGEGAQLDETCLSHTWQTSHSFSAFYFIFFFFFTGEVQFGISGVFIFFVRIVLFCPDLFVDSILKRVLVKKGKYYNSGVSSKCHWALHLNIILDWSRISKRKVCEMYLSV